MSLPWGAGSMAKRSESYCGFLGSQASKASCLSQTLTASTTTSPLNFLATALVCGRDSMQGPHQVAQKSSTTTLPRKSDSLSGLPSLSATVKSGAGVPEARRGGGAGGSQRFAPAGG